MTKVIPHEWVKTELAQIQAAQARGQVEQAAALRAQSAHYDARKKRIVIALTNGSSFSFPPQLAQGLTNARPSELADIELSPQGTGLHWPKLDADLTVEGLLAGLFGSRGWMRAHAAKAGSVKSAVKTQAAKVNGAKGGRPRKARPELA
jgi:Protein of unknown function (DUF2442)